MKIKIFKNKEKEIDLSDLIDSRVLICANSGGGKSYTARKIMEESHNKVMSIVIDVEGEFKSLREKYDYLLVGPDGDVDIDMNSVSMLPRKLLELNVSTIIDISDFKKQDRIKYVKEFLEALMEIPNSSGLWKPCLIFLDEIHNFAGQQEKQDSTWAVIDLATRGRKRGYCLIGCTQRISKLHKDVVAELNNYFVGRTGLDLDMTRAANILGFSNKQDMLSLRDLDKGEFFVFGPSISKKIEKEQVELSKTTHPKRNQLATQKLSSPNEKIKGIVSKLAILPKQKAKELKDLNDYKNEIKELNIELRTLKNSRPKPEIDEKAVERAVNLAIKEAEQIYYNSIRDSKKEYNTLKSKFIAIENIIKSINYDPKEMTMQRPIIPKISIVEKDKKEYLDRKQKQEKIFDSMKQYSKVTQESEFDLNKCEKKIYSLLYQYDSRSFTKSQVGVFTGYSHNSGGFSNALSKLRSLDLIDRSGNDLKVKNLYSELTQDFNFSKEAIMSKLNKCEKEIYEVLLNNENMEFSKEELAEETLTKYSFNSGGFSNALSRLNTFGIIERRDGKIKLNSELLEI